MMIDYHRRAAILLLLDVHERMTAMPFRPEWLPMPGRSLPDGVAELILNYYDDEIGELCAGIAEAMRASGTPGEVSWCRYSVQTISENWAWHFGLIAVAYVVDANIAAWKRFQYVMLFVDKVTGAIIINDPAGLIGEPTHHETSVVPFEEIRQKQPAPEIDMGWSNAEPAKRIGSVPDLRRGG